MSRLLAVLLALAAGAMVVLGTSGPAAAHASLTGSTPADGARLATPPSSVTLRYDENIRDPSVVIVRGPGGRRVDRGDTKVLNNTASVAMTGRGAGTYTVAYRVISADGHPVSATISFRVRGAGSASTSSIDTPRASPQQSNSTWWVVGGALVLCLAAVTILLGGRRSSRNAAGPARESDGA